MLTANTRTTSSDVFTFIFFIATVYNVGNEKHLSVRQGNRNGLIATDLLRPGDFTTRFLLLFSVWAFLLLFYLLIASFHLLMFFEAARVRDTNVERGVANV